MEFERNIFFEGIGEIGFKKGRRYKRISIRIKASDQITVTIPAAASFSKAEAFVKEKLVWIRNAQNNLKVREAKIIKYNELTEFSTRNHDLKIERVEGDKIRRRISDGKILISLPFTIDISTKVAQEFIRFSILEAWRKEAKEILPLRTKQLADQHGFKYNEVSIKNMRTRWGSCSGRNNINLNLHLVRLPSHLCDYIILHELVHTVHKNHGKYFWKSLDALCGDSKARAKELKNYPLEIW